ncbi:MAG: SGNH/GDSL hydrolase family protein [Desulfobacterium sp.]|nr:SGNH/GDSL hydrolase family protein [Desulfobacterium sp.]
MILNLLKFFLAPVLIHQGKKVARETPRLPEAKGLRRGTKGNGERQIRLLILGDSAAAGVGVEYQDQALSGQVLACFGPQYTVNWELIAKTGATTAATIKHMESLPPREFDFVVTSLGVNDVKNGVQPDKWTSQQKRLIALMRDRFKVRRFIISAVPPMELFPALPWPLNRYLGLCAAQMNKTIKKWLKSQPDCEFMEFNLPMDLSLMAEDGFHPGPRLHTIWAKEIFNRIDK